MQTVGIIGLGWLGLPLAKNLVENGFEVKGSVRSEDKLQACQQLGIETCLLDLSIEEGKYETSFFVNCDIAVITIPPAKNSFDTYRATILKACSFFSDDCQFIFTSSTSIYADEIENALEDSPVLSHYNYTSPLFLTEKSLQQKLNSKLTVLRLGGLIDENRNPSRQLSGKTGLVNPDSPVNLVHKEDVIEIICQLIKKQKFGGVYNICCDNHLSRKEFYTKQCQILNLNPPVFSGTSTIRKKVNNSKIKNHLAFQFKHNF